MFQKAQIQIPKKVFKYFQIQILLNLTPRLTEIASFESTSNVIKQSDKTCFYTKQLRTRHLSSLTNLKSSLMTKLFRAIFQLWHHTALFYCKALESLLLAKLYCNGLLLLLLLL